MIERAFVLCGGLGTRLRGAVSKVPKVLAPVAGRPFLDLLIGALHHGGVRRVVLLTGHLAEQIHAHVDNDLRRMFHDVTIEVSKEPAPLGTGGALAHGRRFVDGTFLLLNGDTYIELDARALVAAHRASGAAVTIGAASVAEASRFGALDLGTDGAVRGFNEKGRIGPALVNAGVYVLEPRVVDAIPQGRAVSFEHDIVPTLIEAGEDVRAVTLRGPFVDIGTPESWLRLSHELASRAGSHT